MKENEVEKVFAEYRESLGVCDRRPLRRSIQPVWPKRIGWGIAGIAVLAAAGISLWPQDAQAAALKRVNQAIQDAKTMEVIFTVERPKGKWWQLNHMYYRDGMWRYDAAKSATLESTLIFRDNLLLTDYHCLDHATVKKTSPEEFSEIQTEGSALTFAKNLLMMGREQILHRVTVDDHAPVNGRATYAIHMVRLEGGFQAELVVDKETNLPVIGNATVHQTSGLGEEDVSYRQEYRFNEKLDDRLFSMDIGKPVINVDEGRSALIAQWRKPLAKVPGCAIRDVTVTQDGTVWIAATSAGKALPDKLRSSTGDTYVRGYDTLVADKGERPSSIDGEPLFFVSFINMNPHPRTAKRVYVSFAQRMLPWDEYREYKAMAHSEVALEPKVEEPKVEEQTPAWFPVLAEDRRALQLDIENWNFRAKAYEEKHLYREAALAYEACAEAHRHLVKRGAYFPLIDAARCYEAAGDHVHADLAAAQAEDVRRKKER